MLITLAQAAEQSGVNRSTILRALKRGVISGTRTETGWTVDPAEAFRVFPPKQAPNAAPQAAQTDALVAELRAQLAEMRAQRDAWQRMAEARLIAAPEPAQPKTSLWRWLRSAG